MIYPAGIAKFLRNALSRSKSKYYAPPKLPSEVIMQNLFETAYHASFCTEEGRRVHFRIVYASEAELGGRGSTKFAPRERLIVFDSPREYSISEIHRLAPALDMTQNLICVHKTTRSTRNPKLEIWGICDSGSSWWTFMHHESTGGTAPPNYLTIFCTSPGHLSISAQGQIFATLSDGELIRPQWGVLNTGGLDAFFHSGRQAFYRDVLQGLGERKYDPEGHDEDYPKIFYTHFIERLLFHIQERAHGGTIFFVPDYLTHGDTRLLDRLDIKYPINYARVWPLLREYLIAHRKYYDLHTPLSEGKQLTSKRYNEASFQDWQMTESERSIADCVRFIAGLSGVDGAVVITDRFRVLGFGAEVLVQSQNLSHVTALPKRKRIAIANYGTRHRSAFRFCSSLEESVGFIVSSDGGVKATFRSGPDVILWPDIDVGGNFGFPSPLTFQEVE